MSMMMLVSLSVIQMEGRVRLSRGSIERHVPHVHPIVGTPDDVPVPSMVIRTRRSSKSVSCGIECRI